MLHRLAGQTPTAARPTHAPDLAVVQGSNHYDATVTAVEMLGGMRAFVPRQSRVGLLVNSRFDKPGTYVKPEITMAVIAMCYEAGAKEIISLDGTPGSYSRKAQLSKELSEYIKSIRPPGDDVETEIRGGVLLKRASITRDALECDVFINIPIIKDHEGTRVTGTLKNIMGSTSGSTNRFFHSGSHGKGGYDDIPFLSQCIADANLLRSPTLCIADATEMITTNGPFGPGRLMTPHKVIAGTDRVAVDTYGAGILGLQATDITMIQRAQDHGLGSSDLKSLVIESKTL